MNGTEHNCICGVDECTSMDCDCSPENEIYVEEIRALKLALSTARERIKKLEAALAPFLKIADHCAKTAAEQRDRTARMQEAAKLSRNGRQAEGMAIRDALDRQPRVWDFSRVVDELADAAKPARRALSDKESGT